MSIWACCCWASEEESMVGFRTFVCVWGYGRGKMLFALNRVRKGFTIFC